MNSRRNKTACAGFLFGWLAGAAWGVPDLAIMDASLVEGNSGTNALVFVVQLSEASAEDVTVHYGVAELSARMHEDYVDAPGMVTIPAQSLQGNIEVLVFGDTRVETDEILIVSLWGESNARVVDGSAYGTIWNDDVSGWQRSLTGLLHGKRQTLFAGGLNQSTPALVDFDRDGRLELVTGQGGAGNGGNLHLYRNDVSSGDPLWGLDSEDMGRLGSAARMRTTHLLCADLNSDGRDEVLALSRHADQYPGLLTALNEIGAVIGTFWNPGALTGIQSGSLWEWPNLPNLFLVGVNPDLEAPSVCARFTNKNISGEAPSIVHGLEGQPGGYSYYEPALTNATTSGAHVMGPLMDTNNDSFAEAFVAGEGASLSLVTASNGAVVWQRNNEGFEVRSITVGAQTDGTSFVVAGGSEEGGFGALHAWDLQGNLVWTQQAPRTVRAVEAVDLDGDGATENVAVWDGGFFIHSNAAEGIVFQVDGTEVHSDLAFYGDGARTQIVFSAGAEIRAYRMGVETSLWSATCAAPVDHVFALLEGPFTNRAWRILVARADGWVEKRNAEDGQLIAGSVQLPARVLAIASGDLDGDGNPEVVCATTEADFGRIHVLNAELQLLWTYQPGEAFYPTEDQTSPAFADFYPRDGVDELVLTRRDGAIEVYEMPAEDWAESGWTQASADLAPALAGQGGLGENPRVAFADLDDDGDQDLLVGGSLDFLFYLENIGDTNQPDFALVSTNYAADRAGGAPAPGDVDGDGDIDLIVGRADGTLAFLQNIGTAATPEWAAPEENYAALDVGDDAAPVLGDVTGDGLADLLVGSRGGAIAYLPNTGTASAPAWNPARRNSSTLGFDLAMGAENGRLMATAGDLDLDLDQDILMVTDEARLFYLENVGTPTVPAFRTPAEIPSPVFGTRITGAAMADLPRNWRMDLYLGTADGKVLHLQSLSSRHPVWEISPTNWGFTGDIDVGSNAAPAVVDLGFDNRRDLVVGNHEGIIAAYINQISDTAAKWEYGWSFNTGVPDAVPTLNPRALNDLFVGNNLGTVRHFVSRYSTSPSWELDSEQFGGIDVGRAAQPLLVDLNGDAAMDLLVGEQNGGLNFWINSRPGAMIAPRAITLAEGQTATFTHNASQVRWDLHTATLDSSMDSESGAYTAGTIRATGQTYSDRDVPKAIASGTASTGAIQISTSGALTNLGVWVDIVHPDRGELTVTLFPPASGPIVLHDGSGAGRADLAGSYHDADGIPPASGSLAGLDGAEMQGEWRLVVESAVHAAHSGALHSWGLTFDGGHRGTIDAIWLNDTTSSNLLNCAYANIVSTQAAVRASRAIVVAGTIGSAATDPLQSTTRYLADKAFATLAYRGYSAADIHYLGFGDSAHLDGAATRAGLAQAITNWAADAGELFLYLVDHGGQEEGEGRFKLNAGEFITATELSAWLDALQDEHGVDVTVVIDACNAGSFLEPLEYAGPAKRIVIAACGQDELSYFIAGGLISFSGAFFNGVLLGLDIQQAFEEARRGMAHYQTARIQDNGDGELAWQAQIGPAFIAGQDAPVIGSVAPNRVLDGGALALLWARGISSAVDLHRVWCVIIPPDYLPPPGVDPVVSLPQRELAYNSVLDRYELSDDSFSVPGTYRIIYYAEDIWGGLSQPRYSFVTQRRFSEKVLLVAGPVAAARAAQADSLVRRAWHVFQSRRLDADHIQLLHPTAGWDADGDALADVDGPVGLAQLENAFENWSADADKLTVYLIGETNAAGAFRLNDSEGLDPAVLSGWLNGYQAENRPANVILEFSGSGSYLPALAAPAGRERITIASAKAREPGVWAANGEVSFTSAFLAHVFNGASVGAAFSAARQLMLDASGAVKQQAQLDDNGDGRSDVKSDTWRIAPARYIGMPFLTGADIPQFTAVTPDFAVADGAEVGLWAGVASFAALDEVWCVVTPPDFEEGQELAPVPMEWNPATERYEATVALNGHFGDHVATYFARNVDGLEAIPIQSKIYLAVPDPYEVDDTAEQAGTFGVFGEQTHGFHSETDEDWVVFFASTSYVYQIDTVHSNRNIDTALELEYQLPDGTFSNLVAYRDFNGTNEGERITFQPEQNGFYYVRVYSGNPALFGAHSDYTLRILIPAAGNNLLIVSAIDRFRADHVLDDRGAQCLLNGQPVLSFNGNVNVDFPSLEPGIYTVEVPAPPGYLPCEDPAMAGQVGNPDSYFYGNPRRVVVVEGNSLASLVFLFIPVVQAVGEARDLGTGEWLSGVRIEFTATSGRIAGEKVDGQPYDASYSQPWRTAPDGVFPANVFLPAANWDLAVMRDHYATRLVPNAVASVPKGTTVDLGTLWLAPLDENGNGLSDAWEARYEWSVPPTAAGDDDGDGQSNFAELLAGTDPTSEQSRFSVDDLLPESPAVGLQLIWPAAPGRIYRMRAKGELTDADWTSVGGPWTGRTDQATMQWQIPETPGYPFRYFLPDVASPSAAP